LDWDILPLEGAGPLRFGISPQQVHALLGEPRLSRQRRVPGMATPTLQEMYLPVLGLTYEQAADCDALVAIGFGMAMTEVSYAGVALFAVPPDEVLRLFAAIDPTPQHVAGSIVFVKLGISLTGFHDGAVEDRAISVSALGQWDRLRDRMTPFVLP
jgi:hypothetical protein